MDQDQMSQQPIGDFRPNIYPILYWALAFGVAAGVLLFAVYLMSRYITVVWFPVFLAGLIWGGWRNYKKQKEQWAANAGVTMSAQSPLDEFRQAASDIATVSQDLFNQDENTDQEADPLRRSDADRQIASDADLERESDADLTTNNQGYPPEEPPVPTNQR